MNPDNRQLLVVSSPEGEEISKKKYGSEWPDRGITQTGPGRVLKRSNSPIKKHLLVSYAGKNFWTKAASREDGRLGRELLQTILFMTSQQERGEKGDVCGALPGGMSCMGATCGGPSLTGSVRKSGEGQTGDSQPTSCEREAPGKKKLRYGTDCLGRHHATRERLGGL